MIPYYFWLVPYINERETSPSLMDNQPSATRFTGTTGLLRDLVCTPLPAFICQA